MQPSLLSSSGRRRLLEAAIVATALLLGGCPQDPANTAADPPEVREAAALLDGVARLDSHVERAAMIDRARALLDAPAKRGSRAARLLALEADERKAGLLEVGGRTGEAAAIRASRLQLGREWLAGDPGDGVLRAALAGGLLMTDRGDEGWTLLEGGVEVTDSADAVLVLARSAATFPAWSRSRGEEAAEQERNRRFVPLLRSLRATAERLGAPLAAREEMLVAEGLVLVRLGRREEAAQVVQALDALNPASLEAWKLKQVLAEAR